MGKSSGFIGDTSVTIANRESLETTRTTSRTQSIKAKHGSAHESRHGMRKSCEYRVEDKRRLLPIPTPLLLIRARIQPTGVYTSTTTQAKLELLIRVAVSVAWFPRSSRNTTQLLSASLLLDCVKPPVILGGH